MRWCLFEGCCRRPGSPQCISAISHQPSAIRQRILNGLGAYPVYCESSNFQRRKFAVTMPQAIEKMAYDTGLAKRIQKLEEAFV